MMMAVIAQLEARWPHVNLVLSGEAARDQQAYGMVGLSKISLRKNRVDLTYLSYLLPIFLRRCLLRIGFVMEVDIDVILDASGFAYSDQWPSALRIWHLRNEILRFKKYRKPYLFLPQAFGPFSDSKSRAHISESFPHAAMICARDAESRAHIEACTGKLENPHKYADYTYLVGRITPKNSLLKATGACIIPNHNMLSTRNREGLWAKQYVILLISAINYYSKCGLTPFFLNHEGSGDAALIDRINLQLPHPIEVISEQDPRAVKGIIGTSKAVLCSRYHGCISALSCGIPCVGTSWSHKYDVLYAEYGAEALLLSPRTTIAQLQDMIDISLDEKHFLRRRITEHSQRLLEHAQSMWNELFRVVDQYDTGRNAR